MLVANNKTAAYTLYKSMTGGLIKKTYIALLEGHLNKKSGVIESYMRRCEDSIIKREECPSGEGKYARTEYRVMAESERYSLVEAHPETGRHINSDFILPPRALRSSVIPYTEILPNL